MLGCGRHLIWLREFSAEFSVEFSAKPKSPNRSAKNAFMTVSNHLCPGVVERLEAVKSNS